VAADGDQRNGQGSTLVALEGVGKKWGDYVALAGVDLDIAAGTVVGIAGGNGTGKTTLLRIAAGLILPDAGTIRFRGVDIEKDQPAYREAIGFLSAGDRGLYARLTVKQNLDFWGGLSGHTRQVRDARIDEVLFDFEIEALADRRVDRLSMGQRQRVRLAMTFLHNPSVVFLDEPTTSLDEAGVSRLYLVLADLISEGGAAVIVSPELPPSVTWESWILKDGELAGGRGTADPTQAPVPPKDLTTSSSARY
jgi:ABC-2 type transport system ATP-binding protein